MSEKTLRQKFEEKLRVDGDKHIWTGSLNNIGYPKMKVDGEMILGSHVALKLDGRPVPEGSVVMHKDNNPKNLNPSNLEIGTQKENLKAMRDQGRDRPRGVDQEPDVKQAYDKVKMAALVDELNRIMGYEP